MRDDVALFTLERGSVKVQYHKHGTAALYVTAPGTSPIDLVLHADEAEMIGRALLTAARAARAAGG